MKYKFLFMSLLTVSLMLIVGMIRPEPMNSKSKESFFWNNKVNDINKYNFLVIGDSRAYRGISPSEIEKNLKYHKVKNLGFSSGGFNNHLFELVDKYLDSSMQENIVLICLTPFSLTKSAYDGNQLKILKKIKGFENWKINNLTRNLSFFDPIIPSEIAASFFDYGYFHKYHDNGWVESKKSPINRDKALELYSREFNNNKFQIEYFDILLEEIRNLINKKVNVFVLRMPVYDKLKQLEDSISGFDEEILRFRIEETNAQWIKIQDSLYNTYDGSHLDINSARLLSSIISERIRELIEND